MSWNNSGCLIADCLRALIIAISSSQSPHAATTLTKSRHSWTMHSCSLKERVMSFSLFRSSSIKFKLIILVLGGSFSFLFSNITSRYSRYIREYTELFKGRLETLVTIGLITKLTKKSLLIVFYEIFN